MPDLTIVVSRTRREAVALARQHGIPTRWAFSAQHPEYLEGVPAREILVGKSADIPDKTMAVIRRLKMMYADGVIRYV